MPITTQNKEPWTHEGAELKNLNDVNEVIWMLAALTPKDKKTLLEEFSKNYPELPKPLTEQSLDEYIRHHYGNEQTLIANLKKGLNENACREFDKTRERDKSMVSMMLLACVMSFVATRLLWGSAAASAAWIQLPWAKPEI